MTTYHLTLLVQELLAECIDQVSLDFRAVRATAGAGADGSYDDFALSTDEKAPFTVEFQSATAEFCAGCSVAVRLCSQTEDRFTADVTICRELPQQIVERMVKDYMKARMLAWWYQQRNPEMSQRQAMLAAGFRELLHGMFTPSCTTRRLRYF